MLISPAKTLDMSPMTREVTATQPRFVKERRLLVDKLRSYSTTELAEVMHISEKLAALNAERYYNFPESLSSANAKPALFAFRGDVYRPIHADRYDDATLTFAKQHLRILSGLYGLLRPLDYLYPYRLEMGTKLPTSEGTTLYQFWDKKITRLVAEDLKGAGSKEVLNLASVEYSKAVQLEDLKARVITVEFREKRKRCFR